MTVSDQIISVLDDLCRRFGIAIDWSQQNVIPYLQELAAKYIKYEIWTSAAWCVMMLALLIVAVILTKIAYKNDIYGWANWSKLNKIQNGDAHA